MTSRFERREPVEIETAPGWSLETLVAPAAFYGANGIRVAADGRCWVAQFRGSCVSAWDPASGTIEDVAPPGTSLDGPDDLAFGRDGSAYITEYRAGQVVRLAADGSTETVLADSPGANGITVDADGRLFVDEFRAGGRVIEVDPLGRRPSRVIAELDFPNAFARGRDGRLYVQNVVEGTVSSIDPDAPAEIRHEVDGLAMPSALKFDPNGRLAVVEFTTGRVVAVDLQTGERAVLVELEPGLDNLDFDAAGRLYVSSCTTSDVVRVADGVVDARTASGLCGPYGIAVASDGALLAADLLRIARVDLPGGGLETIWQLDPPGRPFQVVGVAAAREAVYAVTATGDLRRLDVRAGTHELAVAPAPGREVTAAAASGARTVAVRADGSLIELDAGGGVVGERPTGLVDAVAVAVSDDAVAVCAAATGRVVVLPAAGEPWTVDGLADPAAVALDGESLFVAETGTRSVVRHARAGAREVVATGLPLGLPSARARDIRRPSLAIAADGSLLVACDGDGGIRRLTCATVREVSTERSPL